jgi:hypothetical protein
VWDAFRQSTESRPASIARIVQRRAAIQNCCRCPEQQNFCADPPVDRGLKVRPHHRQQTSTAVGCGARSIAVAHPPLPFALVRTSEIAIIETSYEFGTTLQIFNHSLTGTKLEREQGLSLLVGAADSLREG